jgi:sugar-specific transcriptional regulator TrmB
MAKNEYYELLKVGLTDGEAKVYLALSELGSSTVGPIVKKSGIAYSNIYDVLDRLVKKGIVSFVIKSKTKYFKAATPRNLLVYLDNREKELVTQREELKKILPDIEKLQETSTSQEAEIFLGVKGLRTAYEKMLGNATKKDTVFFSYLYDKIYAEEADLFYNSIQHISRKASVKGIANKEYKKSWFAKKSKFLNIKFVDFPIPGNIDVVRDMVLIVSWKPEVIGILIRSESIAKNLCKYIRDIWESVQ